MAEVVGTIASAVTLAGLFKLCIEVFDIVRTSKNQAIDLQKLNLKLSIEKCRLWTWGQAMGLTQNLAPDSPQPLDQCQFISVVEESLSFILSLFNDSQALSTKYGCRKLLQDDESLPPQGVDTPGPIQYLSQSFDNFKVKSLNKLKQVRFVQKSYWVIHDSKKFAFLISEAKALIDGLQDVTKNLTSLAGQDRILRSRITTINDVGTLDMVAEVCEKDHPRISDAASTKADAISLSTTFKRDISNWADDIEDSGSETETIEAIESWTTTEMKHKLFALLKSSRERAAANKAFAREQQTSEMISEAANQPVAPTTYQSDIESNENILQEIATVSMDEDYMDELRAIEQWFRVLSDAERACAFYTLAQQLGDGHIMFFSTFFQYKAAEVTKKRQKMPVRGLEDLPLSKR